MNIYVLLGTVFVVSLAAYAFGLSVGRTGGWNEGVFASTDSIAAPSLVAAYAFTDPKKRAVWAACAEHVRKSDPRYRSGVPSLCDAEARYRYPGKGDVATIAESDHWFCQLEWFACLKFLHARHVILWGSSVRMLMDEARYQYPVDGDPYQFDLPGDLYS